WNMETVFQTAIAFSSSLIPSLMKDFFQASSVPTSGTWLETTLIWQTTPGFSPERARGSWGRASEAGSKNTAIHRMDMEGSCRLDPALLLYLPGAPRSRRRIRPPLRTMVKWEEKVSNQGYL